MALCDLACIGPLPLFESVGTTRSSSDCRRRTTGSSANLVADNATDNKAGYRSQPDIATGDSQVLLRDAFDGLHHTV